MRRLYKCTVCFCLLTGATALFSQPIPQGRMIEGKSMKSRILGRDVHYAVYLPPDYETSARLYPVVYLLHGFTDDESAWIQFGEVNLAADRAIDSRDIPFVDGNYRTRSKKEFRGVAGLSMGGWGALVYAFKHPDLFSACVAFSAAVWTDDEFVGRPDEEFDRHYRDLFGPRLRGQDRLSPHYRKNNPADLVRTLPVESLKSVHILIDCGDDDFLSAGNAMLHLLLRDKGIRHEYRVRDGGHNWTYWRTGIADGLKFIGQAFHR